MRQLGVVVLLLFLVGCASQPAETTSHQPTEEDQQELAKIYLDMGLAYLRRGEIRRAQERLEKAYAIQPEDVNIVHYLAEVYNRLGKTAEAEVHYRKALELTPEDPNLLNNFAALLCSQGSYVEAEEIFIKVAENPTYTTPYVSYENAGRCALRNGEKGKAEGYFSRALRMQPKLALSLYHMADLQYDKGEHFRARAFLERYLEVGAASAEVLLLGYKIEKELGDDQMASSYAEQLVKNFRDSEQTAELRELERAASREQDLTE